MSRWDSLVKRLRSEGRQTLKNNRNDGCAIISVHILVDGDGEPLLWVVHDGKRIEPSRDALAVIASLTST